MADDRVILVCKGCGGWKMLLKHFATSGPTTRDNGILPWLDTHADCHPHRYNVSLHGDPGFIICTEDTNLDFSKQNVEGPKH
jgi:hypothetical protein